MSQLTQLQTNADARWTKLVLTTYRDPLGKERTWESAERSVPLPLLPHNPGTLTNHPDPPQELPN